MSEIDLRIREERKYSPDEIGMATPLLFRSPSLLIYYETMGIVLRHVQADRAELTIDAQVSEREKDRAIVPVWMIRGETDFGFVRGVLRPKRQEYNAAGIYLSRVRQEFHYAMLMDDQLEVGREARKSIITEHSCQTLAMPSEESLAPEDITPNFRVYLDEYQFVPVLFQTP